MHSVHGRRLGVIPLKRAFSGGTSSGALPGIDVWRRHGNEGERWGSGGGKGSGTGLSWRGVRERARLRGREGDRARPPGSMREAGVWRRRGRTRGIERMRGVGSVGVRVERRWTGLTFGADGP